MFCLAVVFLLRRADKSALVSLTIVYEGVKAKAAARTYNIQVSGRWGNWESGELFALKQNRYWIFLFFLSLLFWGGGRHLFYLIYSFSWILLFGRLSHFRVLYSKENLDVLSGFDL